MKLSDTAMGQIRGNNRVSNQVFNRIGLAMNKNPFTILRWYKMNADNGPLTTAVALQIIAEETGLTQEEILDTNETVAP